jgi:hypothetical protein
MAMKIKSGKKAPSQNPVSFYQGDDKGGAYGKPEAVPDRLPSGPMREKLYGRPNLSKAAK